MGELPAKLFFRIGEVAGLVGVEPHVLRYWEREFRSIRPTKSAKGQRVYSRKDVENLLRVRDLLYRDGFTIAGAKKKLQRGPGEPEHEDDEALGGEAGYASLLASGVGRSPTEKALSADAMADSVADDEVVSSEVVPRIAAAAAHAPPETVREKLVALRGEVEAFLDELGTSSGKKNNGR